ncbi:hypothetical protein FSARC_5605 [Fusarium sarcochroum]|uniref:Zn(2)-C6 fungal-type domain-containing protein n=1 Tax=Fusarium sarcochroum TaxID=1208366 RepID=A0A8H4XA05_9HYPO|nr:hypothetical protein FSARC_5605 [Fusarium sarcochroum]
MVSLTSIERDAPPPRRKSCQACKKSRRRCDQGRPTCQRCLQRNIDCRYPDASTRTARRLHPPQNVNVSQIEPQSQDFPSFDMVETPSGSSCLGMLDSILEPTDDFTSQLFKEQEPLECDSSIPSGLDLVSDPMGSNPPLLTTAQIALDRSQLVFVPQVTRMISSRLQYIMDKILTAPSQMVFENHMPWCHAHLYDDGMPKFMQYAVSSAALHAAKNEKNARVIRDNIEDRVQDLLSSPPATTPLEALAYAQALFMYQVLRLTETDVRIRFTYEATMPHLEEAAHALIPYIDFDGTWYTEDQGRNLELIPLYPTFAAQGSWASWVFQESARRTLSIINFFVLTYYFMKGEPGRCSQNQAVSRSVIMSAHLWNAQDPIDFALAWRNKKHYLIDVEKLNDVMTTIDDAGKDDIDDFGILWLVALLGFQEAKGWLAMRSIML